MVNLPSVRPISRMEASGVFGAPGAVPPSQGRHDASTYQVCYAALRRPAIGFRGTVWSDQTRTFRGDPHVRGATGRDSSLQYRGAEYGTTKYE